MRVVCCLFEVCWLPFVVSWGCWWFVAVSWSFAISRVLYLASWFLFDVCGLLCVACGKLSFVCCLLYVVCCFGAYRLPFALLGCSSLVVGCWLFVV